MTPLSKSFALRSTLTAAVIALFPAMLHAQDASQSDAQILARHRALAMQDQNRTERPSQPGFQPPPQPNPQPASTPTRSALPPTPPTALPAPNTLPAPIAATSIPPSTQARRATVTYAAGLIDVRADDSSLNQILRSIARLTGMTITGGVADQRVFGNYGPAERATILATLLDGTGSNMLLRESATDAPSELVLTPRNGGATPPNPNAPGFDDGAGDDRANDEDNPHRDRPLPPRGFPGQAQPPLSQQPAQASQQQLSGPPSVPQPDNNVNGSSANVSPTASQIPTTDSVPLDAVPTPSTTPSSTGIVDAPNPPAAGSTTGTNPNGVATPEQIYQQLQQLQQKQAAQQSTPQ